MVDYSERAKKAWDTRGRTRQGAGSGNALSSRGDYARPARQSDEDWANGITQAYEDDAVYGRIHEEWMAQSDATRSAVDGYMGDYENINDKLRTGAKEDAYGRTIESTALAPKIKAMDDAFRNPLRTKGDEAVYRGLTDSLLDLEQGDVIEDKGFVSTTLSPGVARMYGKTGDYSEGHPLYRKPPEFPEPGEYNPMTGHTAAEDAWRAGREVVARIRLPRGTAYLAGDPESAEMVLPRGSRFRVLRAGRDSDGRRAYEMELLP